MQIVECVKKSIQFLIKLRRMPNLKIKGIVLIVSDEWEVMAEWEEL